MVTFGSDSHKRTHTLVAVDENGRQLGERTVAATPSGHMEAVGWGRQWPERRWALENCRHLSRVLERDLLSAGEAVVQVSPKLMGMARRSGRELGKSDPLTRWRWPVRHCVNPIFRSRSWRARTVKSSCWWTTGRTWSESGLEYRIDCSGISMSWSQATKWEPVGCSEPLSWRRSAVTSKSTVGWWLKSLASW